MKSFSRRREGDSSVTVSRANDDRQTVAEARSGAVDSNADSTRWLLPACRDLSTLIAAHVAEPAQRQKSLVEILADNFKP
jgi:hypothetical protein